MSTEKTPADAPPEKPAFDARTASAAEVDAALRAMERDAFRRRCDAAGAATLAKLQREFEGR